MAASLDLAAQFQRPRSSPGAMRLSWTGRVGITPVTPLQASPSRSEHLGTWRCGCGGDPRCARQQLSSDVGSLLKRHENELQKCLDRWSAKQEMLLERPAQLEKPTPSPFGSRVTGETKSCGLTPAAKKLVVPHGDCPWTGRSSDADCPLELSSSISPVRIFATPPPECDLKMLDGSSGSKVRLRHANSVQRQADAGAALRSAGQAGDHGDESAVYISNIETPDSFRMHSRLDHLPSLDDNEEGQNRTPVSQLQQSSSEGSPLRQRKSPRKRIASAWTEDRPSPPRKQGSRTVSMYLTPDPTEVYGDRWQRFVSSAKTTATSRTTLVPWSCFTSQGAISLTKHPMYEFANAGVIVLNAILLLFETEYRATNAVSHDTKLLFNILSDVFCLIFLGDLIARVQSSWSDFLKPQDRYWNLFDVCVVGTAMLETIARWFRYFIGVEGYEGVEAFLGKFSMLRIIRLLRVIKGTRMLRVSKFARELRIMVFSLTSAMKSLLWAVVLMLVILLMFGVFFTDGAVAYTAMRELKGDPPAPQLMRYFGTLSGSTVSLYMAMSGGADWGEIYEALRPLPLEYRLVFLAFVTLTVFALVNVIMAVFVENAMQRSQNDREFLVQQELETKLEFVAQMQRLFEELDTNRSGTLTLDEFAAKMNDENVLSYLGSLGLDIDQVQQVLGLLDRDQNGELDMEEFITGCLRLRGSAKSLDMAILQYNTEYILQTVTDLVKIVEDRFGPDYLPSSGTEEITDCRELMSIV
eukprot:TRINITY_DN80791_c0_g1_i1.p1 TRINITY_DN80791_c0_g1~~TRINITY_DN80791_c0_g1_i1.p1  ORF type:complete len:753 (-),score=147.97 TRINITY_DN80791_c0_g1_i1:396-2654(-)